MTVRGGRPALHIHSAASDGGAGVEEILEHVRLRTDLDVIAITDHERIDAALAARAIALARGDRFEVIVGEEGTTRDGRAEVRGRVLRDGTGRDLGYPGGRQRPPRFDEREMGERERPG